MVGGIPNPAIAAFTLKGQEICLNTDQRSLYLSPRLFRIPFCSTLLSLFQGRSFVQGTLPPLRPAANCLWHCASTPCCTSGPSCKSPVRPGRWFSADLSIHACANQAELECGTRLRLNRYSVQAIRSGCTVRPTSCATASEAAERAFPSRIQRPARTAGRHRGFVRATEGDPK